ncbi:MAG: hypothetical protein WAT09_13925 [Paracoccaceae bacterium]
MSQDKERMHRLQDIAALVMDSRSQVLRRANDDRAALLKQLSDLEAGSNGADLPWPAPEMTRFAYEQWAAGRRAEINLRLAAQTVVCLQAADETRQAFGRQQALNRIADIRRKGQLS